MGLRTRRADLGAGRCYTQILVALNTFSWGSSTEPTITEKPFCFIRAWPFSSRPQLYGERDRERATVCLNLSGSQHISAHRGKVCLLHLLQYQIKDKKQDWTPRSKYSCWALKGCLEDMWRHYKWLFFQNSQVSEKTGQQENTFNHVFFNSIKVSSRRKKKNYRLTLFTCYPSTFLHSPKGLFPRHNTS